MSEFFQTPPELTNTFENDALLRSYVRRKFPESIRKGLESDYLRLGHRAVTDLLELSRSAELNKPLHVPYEPWGRRVDRIETSDAWKNLDRVSAEEGMVAIGYEKKNGALSRVDQFIRLYLFHASSAFYTCPLAMTDGAARLIEVYGDEELKKNAYRHLTSRDPAQFWTSGQWMTERTGGSDVSGTETVAKMENGEYRLYGTKWFTSATTSQMAMTLARIEGEKALSLFYLELRDRDGNLKNIRVNRLKDKLGTRALPTAELTLEGVPARLVGGPGDGVKKIATLFNITRIYNSCCAISTMRRGVTLARDYSAKRRAFGKRLDELPLHVEALADLETETEAGFHLTFHVVELLGKEELGQASSEEKQILRILTPIAKLFTGRQGVHVASEVLEAFGGAGYIEDTGLPLLLRDAQVFSIWEGTTNVLSLDTLRAIEKEKALPPLLKAIQVRLDAVKSSTLKQAQSSALQALKKIQEYAEKSGSEEVSFQQAGARSFAYSLARVTVASLMLEHADWALTKSETGAARFVHAAQRWCEQDLAPLIVTDARHREMSTELARF